MEIGWDGIVWIDLAQDRDQWMARAHGNEPSGSIKCWKVLEQLHDWWLLKKGSAPGVSEQVGERRNNTKGPIFFTLFSFSFVGWGETMFLNTYARSGTIVLSPDNR
jgi:hypothetical protein